MIAQPSPEAVELVHAVIRAERECVEEEERAGYKTPRHWLLIGKLDAASEALLQRMTKDEQDAARYRFLRDNGLAKALRSRHPGLMELAFGYPSDETVFKTGLAGGYTPDLIDAAIDAARTPSEVTT